MTKVDILDSFDDGGFLYGAEIYKIVDEARRSGFNDGIAFVKEGEIGVISAQLAKLQLELEGSDEKFKNFYRKGVAAIGVALAAIVELLAPKFQQERLIESLSDELKKFEQDRCKADIVIRCSADLADEISKLIKQFSFGNILIDSCGGVAEVEIRTSFCRIGIDYDDLLGACRRVVSDLEREGRL